MAGAQVHLQAVIQLVAEASAVDGAVVGHVELGVRGQKRVAGGDAVIEPSVQPGTGLPWVEGQVCILRGGENIQLRQVRVGDAEGGRQGEGEPSPGRTPA